MAHITLILFFLFSLPFFQVPGNLLFWLFNHLISQHDADGSTNVVADYSKLTSLFHLPRDRWQDLSKTEYLKRHSIQSFNTLRFESRLLSGINRAYQSTWRPGASRDSLGCSRPQESTHLPPLPKCTSVHRLFQNTHHLSPTNRY